MKKYVVGIAVVILLAVIVGIVAHSRAYCTEMSIDINSGDIRKQKYVMFFRAADTVETTEFSAAARDAGIVGKVSAPVWKVVEIRDTPFRRVYIYNEWHGSRFACERFIEWVESQDFSEAERKESIGQAIGHLRNGEIKEMILFSDSVLTTGKRRCG